MEIPNLKKDAVKYRNVGLALLILTVVTVLAAKLHLGIVLGVILALLIAAFKSSLVASFFMHLNHEKQVIYYILIFTVIFFLGMIVLLIAGQHDLYEGAKYVP